MPTPQPSISSFHLCHLQICPPSTSLTIARTITSEVQFLHLFFTNLIPLGDKHCVDGYFRPEAGDVVMLDMIDSSQDKSGKTEGRSSRGLAHWKGLSVGRWWSRTFVLICVEMNALDLSVLGSGAPIAHYNTTHIMVSLPSSPWGKGVTCKLSSWLMRAYFVLAGDILLLFAPIRNHFHFEQ